MQILQYVTVKTLETRLQLIIYRIPWMFKFSRSAWFSKPNERGMSSKFLMWSSMFLFDMTPYGLMYFNLQFFMASLLFLCMESCSTHFLPASQQSTN